VRKAETLQPSSAVVMQSGNLNFLEPYGPVQTCNGTAIPFARDKFLHQLFSFSPRRTNQDFEIEVYRKPTSTDTNIHQNS
jgi:hypothetical protein